MFILTRAANHATAKPGQWWSSFGSGERAGLRWISVCCPECKRAMSLHRGGEGHAVANDGAVSPSLVCPYAGCSWHVYVRLAGFDPPLHKRTP